MNIEGLTKEQINEMSTEELLLWGEVFAKQEQAKRIRKILLDYIEIKDEKNILEN